jgi:cytochrome c
MKTSLYALLAAALLLGGCGKKEAPAPVVASAPAAALPAATMPAANTATATDVEGRLKQNACMACHSVDKKLVGPAYSWVAYRYKDDKDAASKLSAAVRNGSSGKWTAYTGNMAMPAHPQLSDADILAMVQWVLGQKPTQPPKS